MEYMELNKTQGDWTVCADDVPMMECPHWPTRLHWIGQMLMSFAYIYAVQTRHNYMENAISDFTTTYNTRNLDN
jgi:hypothetical protein